MAEAIACRIGQHPYLTC